MTNKELDWPALTAQLSKLASSQKAKEECLELSPMQSAQSAQMSALDVTMAQILLEADQISDFTSLDFISPILDRLQIQAVLDVKELLCLRQFLNTTMTLKMVLKSVKNKWSDSQGAKLSDFKPQISAINHVITADGEINEDASETLSNLSQEKRRLVREISRTLDQIVLRRQMEPYLQDRFVTNREGRMVIPVKSGSQHDVKGLIHDASQTKQTVFMEPEEVIPLNNRLREVQILIQEEIHRILKELTNYLVRFYTPFVSAAATLLDCDITFAKAKLNHALKGTVVRFSEKGELNLKDLKHPLLILQGIDVVPNSVTLNKGRRILLLSGPNAGGKTILLKALGLGAEMARSGLPVSVSEGSFMPFFSKADPIIGDLQSVGENLSSFSSHIVRLTKALSYKGQDTLILIDEICGATDPEEGVALARSFIEHFSGQNVFSAITSHLGALKDNWPSELGVEHGSLEFDTKTNRPTFQLLLGFPGRSLALSVAQRLGVPESLLDRARTFLSPESQKRTEELGQIEEFKQNILELKAEIQVDRDEAKKSKEQYMELIKKFREQRDHWLEKALSKAEKKVENLIEAARQDRLQSKTLSDIKAELPEIIKGTSPSHRPQTLEDFKNQFKPGTPAFSTRLGRQVLVQSEPDNKGQVHVLADSMRVQLPWHTLITVSTEDDKPITIRRSSASSTKTVEDQNAELDLRGKRIDDAIPLLEKWLDDCLRSQRDQVKVIHGFGTEQLKKAIRQFLSKNRYVSKWTPGDSTSGGDGITWVNLSD